MVVENEDGRIRTCIVFKDLSKASPNYDFPLPHIEILVDNAEKNATYSFMYGFLG